MPTNPLHYWNSLLNGVLGDRAGCVIRLKQENHQNQKKHEAPDLPKSWTPHQTTVNLHGPAKTAQSRAKKIIRLKELDPIIC